MGAAIVGRRALPRGVLIDRLSRMTFSPQAMPCSMPSGLMFTPKSVPFALAYCPPAPAGLPSPTLIQPTFSHHIYPAIVLDWTVTPGRVGAPPRQSVQPAFSLQA